MRSRGLVCWGMVLLAAMAGVSLAGVATAEAAVASTATDRPIAVSPGSAARVALIANRCPTFSWGGVAEARGYELVVYGVAEGGGAVEVLRKSFPGAVGSWTPALGSCLATGEQYAWSVRALGPKGPSEWSAPALLKVAAAASQAELLEALAVVRRYLADNPGALGLPGEPAAGAGAGAAPSPDPAKTASRAPAATELSVAGGVEAASFSGDGSALTDLTPANLAAGTAAIDITGSAADVTGTVAVAHGGTGATSAAQACVNLGAATTTQLTAHAAADDHAATYVNVAGDTMSGGLGMGNSPITDIGAPGTDFTATGGLNLADDLMLEEGETISNPVPETIRFSDGSDILDIDLSGSVSLMAAPGSGEFSIDGAPGSGGGEGTTVRIRSGAGDGAGDGGDILLSPGDGGGGGGTKGTVQVLGDLTATTVAGDGSGLTGIVAATAAALAANGANCPPGMVAVGVNAAGAAECTTDADALGGLSCANGQVAKWNAGGGIWQCGSDSGADGYFSSDLRIDGDLGIGTDPLPGSERNIYMYDGGIYSDPQLYISGHNSGFIKLERRRTDSSIYTLRAGCGSVNCINDFSITHSTAGTCIAIRDGCDVDIPKLEVDTFKSNPTDSPGSCDTSTEGNFYYDDSLDEPCFCNGSDWRQFDGGGTC